MVVGNGMFIAGQHAIFLPGAMRFEICFVNHIETITVAEFIDIAAIRIMRATQGVDILPLHRDDILLKFRRIHRPPAIAVKLMAVHTLEHNALAIDFHQAIFEFELTEAHIIGNDLLQIVRVIINSQKEFIQMRMLGTPKFRAFHRQDKFILPSGPADILLSNKLTFRRKQADLDFLGMCP